MLPRASEGSNNGSSGEGDFLNDEPESKSKFRTKMTAFSNETTTESAELTESGPEQRSGLRTMKYPPFTQCRISVGSQWGSFYNMNGVKI